MDLSIDELKCNLTLIIRNEISKFNLVNLAKKLNVSLNYEESFLFQKKTVEHEILQHILLQDQSEQFSDRLADTRNWLGKKSDIGYSCTFTGCFWNGSMHRQYLEHVRRVHFLNKNILCNFGKKCPEQFDTVQAHWDWIWPRLHPGSSAENSDKDHQPPPCSQQQQQVDIYVLV